MFVDYRVFYEKTGRLKYISHLDTNRLMQRALKRSGLPVWYSEGFNPHIYITFALPLALGLESRYEVMDFRLTVELPLNEIERRLNEALPEGLSVFNVDKPVQHKAQEITSAAFTIKFAAEKPDELAARWRAFLSQPEILTEKKTKKGMKTIDILPDIAVKSETVLPDGVQLELVLPAGVEKNISPFLVTETFGAFSEELAEGVTVTKTGVFTKDGELFR